ncbi:MAG: divergent polysaccharide deacetylase family protein [Gammaproteobacteria bacterium]|nr:divergent polysaccharide deacetylase family protein [Gammaproteobacteria bacterium]
MRCSRLRRDLHRHTLLLLAALALGSAVQADSVPRFRPATVVLIIDDLGHHLAQGLRAVELPGKVTLAILPHTPGARLLAERATAAGKEVILHAPMSNVHHKPLGPGGLTDDMTEQDFRETLSLSLRSTPHARGVSNHMGSYLTGQREPMVWLMQELGQRGLYFVDSRTSSNTVAASTAAEFQIPTLSRQVFLDNIPSPDAIASRFEEVLELASRMGIGVAIGHPYDPTLEYLQKTLPTLSARGYRLALVSEALVFKARQPGVRLGGMPAN